jgi:hypothetical protein
LLDELLATQQVPEGTIGHHLKVGEVQIQTTPAGRGRSSR